MKRLARKIVRFNGFTLGLDVHKKFIEYCFFDKNGDCILEGKIGSSHEELRALLAKLKAYGPIQAALEACGCFIWIFDVLVAELSRECVHVANPSRLHVVANSMEKNDRNDAWWLGYYLYEGRLPESFVAEGNLRDLRIACRELRSFTNIRGDLLRRLKSHFAQEGIKAPKSWHTSKIRREKVLELISQVKGERQKALHMLYKQIRKLTRQMTYWNHRVLKLSEALPEIKTLKTEMSGFGPIISSAIIGELGDPKRFHNEKAYAKATGLTPGYRKTGGKESVTGITRAGSCLARWAFTRAVVACLRCKKGDGLQIRQWVEHRSRHKPKRKVIVAAARKLAEGVWRLFAMGETFNLALAFPVRAAA